MVFKIYKDIISNFHYLRYTIGKIHAELLLIENIEKIDLPESRKDELVEKREGTPIDFSQSLQPCQKLLNEIIRNLQTLSISPQIIREMSDIHAQFSELNERFFSDYKEFNRYQIFKMWNVKIKNKTNLIGQLSWHWEERILSDMKKIPLLQLSDKPNLILEKGVRGYFESYMWEDFSQLEKDDLEDGWNCIWYGLWTPATIMFMRTIESALRTYYENVTGTCHGNKTWGNLLEILERNENSDKYLLKYFDYLRSLRNPIAHPEVRCTLSDAEDAFHQVRHILTRVHSN